MRPTSRSPVAQGQHDRLVRLPRNDRNGKGQRPAAHRDGDEVLVDDAQRSRRGGREQRGVVPGQLRHRVRQLLKPAVVRVTAVVKVWRGAEHALRSPLRPSSARPFGRADCGVTGAASRFPRAGRRGARGSSSARSRRHPGPASRSPERDRVRAGPSPSREAPRPRSRPSRRRAEGSAAGRRSSCRRRRARRPTIRGSARSGCSHFARRAVSSCVRRERRSSFATFFADRCEIDDRRARRRRGCRRGPRASRRSPSSSRRPATRTDARGRASPRRPSRGRSPSSRRSRARRSCASTAGVDVGRVVRRRRRSSRGRGFDVRSLSHGVEPPCVRRRREARRQSFPPRRGSPTRARPPGDRPARAAQAVVGHRPGQRVARLDRPETVHRARRRSRRAGRRRIPRCGGRPPDRSEDVRVERHDHGRLVDVEDRLLVRRRGENVFVRDRPRAPRPAPWGTARWNVSSSRARVGDANDGVSRASDAPPSARCVFSSSAHAVTKSAQVDGLPVVQRPSARGRGRTARGSTPACGRSSGRSSRGAARCLSILVGRPSWLSTTSP